MCFMIIFQKTGDTVKAIDEKNKKLNSVNWNKGEELI